MLVVPQFPLLTKIAFLNSQNRFFLWFRSIFFTIFYFFYVVILLALFRKSHTRLLERLAWKNVRFFWNRGCTLMSEIFHSWHPDPLSDFLLTVFIVTADSVASFLLTLSTQINIVFEIVFHFFYKHITFYVLKKKNKSTILARTAINRRIIYNKKRNISVRVHNIFEWLIFYLKTKLVLYIDWSYHHSISPE